MLANFTQRHRLAIASLALGMTMAVVWFLMTRNRYPKLTPGNFSKISLGMTLKEAEGILGVPPGIYHDAPNDVQERLAVGRDFEISRPSFRSLPPECIEWWSNEYAFRLEVGPDQRVVMTYRPQQLSRRRPPTFSSVRRVWEWVRGRLGGSSSSFGQ